MKAIWFDKEVIATVKNLGNLAIEESCDVVTNNVKNSMIEGTGLFWPSAKPGGGMHQASVVGVPPSPDTEELKNSISWAMTNGKKGGAEGGDQKVSIPIFGENVEAIIGRVGTTNDKGVRHELGLTWYSAKRPFLRPQIDKSGKEVFQIIKKYLGK